jgi:hypothetical protein
MFSLNEQRTVDAPAQNGESSDHAQTRISVEADERTRLLPPPPHGYLSPDDPAASYPFLSELNRNKFLEKLRNLSSQLLRTCESLANELKGISVQPLERTILALLHCALHHHKLSLVGAAVGIYLRGLTWIALARFWLLRFLIHDLDVRTSPDRPPILLNTF